MRLLSVDVRNYRIHASRQVEFDPARTLIGGPNESGKSTLIEAVHRALFLTARGNSKEHQRLRSQLHPGEPEVRLAFEAGGVRHELTKRFGVHGSVSLVIGNAPPLQGQSAEVELARILGVEAGLGGRGMNLQWSHLWVWQGLAITDPSVVEGCPHAALLQRLQSQGGAGVLQSDLDEAVARQFAEAVAAGFNANGRPKIDSALGQATTAYMEAERLAGEARERWLGLETTAASLVTARSGVDESESQLRQLSVSEMELGESLAEVARLRQTEGGQTTANRDAMAAVEAIRGIRKEIATLREEFAAKVQELSPLELAAESSGGALDLARSESHLAEQAYAVAQNGVRRQRQLDEMARAWKNRFEALVAAAEWTEKSNRVQTLRTQENGFRTDIASMPQVDASVVRRLQELENLRATAEARLMAMAAGVEVLRTDEPVIADGTPLVQGQTHVFTEVGEVMVGRGVHLRIRPGGGASLTEARQEAAEARNEFQSALDRLGLPHLDAATAAFEKRAALERDLEMLEQRLNDLAADDVGARLNEADHRRLEFDAEIARLGPLLGENIPSEPATAAEAVGRAQATSEALRSAESAENTTRAAFNTVRQQLETAQKRHDHGRIVLEERRRERYALEVRLGVLVGRHGDDAALSQSLSSTEAQAEVTRLSLQRTVDALETLQPELLAQRQLRLTDIRRTTQQRLDDCRQKVIEDTTTLRLQGEGDPHGAWNIAEARLRSGRSVLDETRGHAEAQRLLNRLFSEERQSLADLLTRPFQERIAHYLETLFGAGTSLHVRFNDGEFGELGLLRPGIPGGAFAFEHLSGGTREQTAVAVRLAMAEVLATEHGGCLPVVLDDAFAYSDPDRVGRLQDMLYLASQRGLQVIVLSCNPADYSGLGARVVLLQRPLPPPAGGALLPQPLLGSRADDWESSGDDDKDDGRPDDGPETPVPTGPGPSPGPSSTAGSKVRFLEALQGMGGSAGNQSLQRCLGWDDATYQVAKRALLDEGRIRIGQGRGGSVRLNSQGNGHQPQE